MTSLETFIDAAIWHGGLDRPNALLTADPDLARGSIFGFRAAIHHLGQRGLKNMFGVHLGGGRVIGREKRDRFREKDLIKALIGFRGGGRRSG